ASTRPCCRRRGCTCRRTNSNAASPAAGAPLPLSPNATPKESRMRKVPLKITFLALSAMFAGAACSDESTPANTAAPAPAAATPAADTDVAAADAAAGAPAPEQDVQLVQFGASMYAAAEFCKLDHDLDSRQAMREQQKQATVAQGRMSAGQF